MMKREDELKNTVYCGQGHGYDPEQYDYCPYCYGEEANKQLEMTQPAAKAYATAYASAFDDEITPTVPSKDVSRYTNASATGTNSYFEDDDERTVSASMKKKGMNPIVGWLVALNGDNKGQDYRIHEEKNYIGRNPNSDICIRGDQAISKENHACIAYETKHKKFFFIPGNSRNIAYINENAIFTTTELKPYDIIELGVTKFVFVAFCGDKFDWDEILSEEEEGGDTNE